MSDSDTQLSEEVQKVIEKDQTSTKMTAPEKKAKPSKKDDFSISKEQANIVAMIDKKVTIKEKVERGKKKTVVSGLEIIDDLSTEKGLKEFSKKLKTSFGCGCQITKDEDTKKDVLIFQGNHRDKIYTFIKSKYPNTLFG